MTSAAVNYAWKNAMEVEQSNIDALHAKERHPITVLTVLITMELISGSVTVRQSVAALLIILLHFMEFR